MQAKVTKHFHDKENQMKLFKPMQEWEGTQERFQEINRHKRGPFLEALEEEKPTPKKRKTKERKLDTETK